MAKSVPFCCLLFMFVSLFINAAFSLEPPLGLGVSPSPSPESAADSPPLPSPAPFHHAPATSPPESPSNSPPAPPPSDLTPTPTPTPSPARAPSSPPTLAPSPTADSDFSNSVAKTDGVESEASKGGMNGGKKAGIAVGVIAAACFVGIGGIVYKKRQDNIRRSQYGNAARSSFL